MYMYAIEEKRNIFFFFKKSVKYFKVFFDI